VRNATFAGHGVTVVPRAISALSRVALGSAVDHTFQTARRTFCNQQVRACGISTVSKVEYSKDKYNLSLIDPRDKIVL